MIDPVFWLVFFSAALALNLSPNPFAALAALKKPKS